MEKALLEGKLSGVGVITLITYNSCLGNQWHFASGEGLPRSSLSSEVIAKIFKKLLISYTLISFALTSLRLGSCLHFNVCQISLVKENSMNFMFTSFFLNQVFVVELLKEEDYSTEYNVAMKLIERDYLATYRSLMYLYETFITVEQAIKCTV